MPDPQIHFCTASDGVRIAYAITGTGYPLLWVPGWLSHAEVDWDFPSLGERYHALTKDFMLLRIDKRVFEDRGEQEMKGVGDAVRVYAVQTVDSRQQTADRD